LLQRIAEQPQALWLGEWSGDVGSTVADTMRRAGGTLPVFVLYNLPYRDCGSHSAGGVETETAYRTWVRRVRSGIAGRPAVTILEPDALGLLDRCLSEEQQESRLALMTDAVNVLRQDADTAVYVDAGHSRWVAADVMADRLRRAGVRNAHGFALNTSNYGTTEENVAYGERLSALLGGAHFVIDTSRNGVGPTPDGAWCNPPGRKLGAPPTTETGNDLVDAWLWLKRPGESDGECNGGPRAGMFWDAQAFELAE
jgi:endoglucanase